MSMAVSTPGDTSVESLENVEIEFPKKFKVVLHNDDETSFEHVIYILTNVFQMTIEEAHEIAQATHFRGRGICGVFPKEIAETKVKRVKEMAMGFNVPLQCTLEEE